MEEIFYQPISCVTSSVLDYGESVSRLQGMGGGAEDTAAYVQKKGGGGQQGVVRECGPELGP